MNAPEPNWFGGVLYWRKEMEIREIRFPASVGWRRELAGREVEVAWPRGTTILLMSSRQVGQNAWLPIAVMDSDRWSHDGTYNGALGRAHEFLSGLRLENHAPAEAAS